MLSAWWQGIANPLPHFQVVGGQWTNSHDQIQAFPCFAPLAPRSAQNSVRSATQSVKEVPRFDRVKLHRGRRRQQHALGSLGDLIEKVQEVICVGRFGLSTWAEIFPSRPVRLVDNDTLVAECLQVL